MAKYPCEILKISSILPVFLIVPNYANALTKYDLADGENIVLDSTSTITNEVQIESADRATGISAAGKTSITTGENTLHVIANSITTSGGHNYIFDTVTAGTDFTFIGNLVGTTIGTGNVEARGIRHNATSTVNFSGNISIQARTEDGFADGVDMWGGSNGLYSGNVVIFSESNNSNALGLNLREGSNITFSGAMTSISTDVLGDGIYSYAVQNYNNNYGVARFQADKTILNATGGKYAYGAQIYKGNVFFEGDTTVSVSGGRGSNRAVALEANPGKDTASVDFLGENIVLNSRGTGAIGLYASGGTTAYSASKNMTINSEFSGILSQYAASILLDYGSNTTINVKSDDTVIGIWGAKYPQNTGAGGTIVSNGTISVNASGADTYGILIQDESVFNAKHVNVSASGTGQTMAMGIENATDVVIGNGGMESQLIAHGAESYGLFVDETSAVKINGDIKISGDTYDIYNDGAINIAAGKTAVLASIAGDGTLTISDDATLLLGSGSIDQGEIILNGTVLAALDSNTAYGHMYAESITGDGTLKLTNVYGPGTYKMFNVDNDIKIDAGFLYNVINNGAAGVVISDRSLESISADTGMSLGATAVTMAMAKSPNRSFLATYKSIANQIENDYDGLFAANIPYLNDQAARAHPYDKPVLHSVTTSLHNQIADLTVTRMAAGRAGGDIAAGYGAWIQGMRNKSKYSDNFDSSTGGIAFGLDTLLNRKYTIGIGYANNSSEVDAHNRDIDIEAHSLFAYAQYKPNKWFVNAMASYTRAEYDEETTMFGIPLASEYDVNSYGAQAMTGYNFATGITPEAGVRYLHMDQDSYSNGLLNISGADSDFATAVAGIRYAFDIQSNTTVRWSPEFRAAATYDFLSDDVYSTVSLPGVVNYRVRGDRLSRMGGEFGIGIAGYYNGLNVSLNYELALHEDYTSQSGILKLKYNF